MARSGARWSSRARSCRGDGAQAVSGALHCTGLASVQRPRPVSRPHGLSKSRYTAGLQCHKQLWWRVHEPTSPELVPNARLQSVFDAGARVGEVAAERRRDYGRLPACLPVELPGPCPSMKRSPASWASPPEYTAATSRSYVSCSSRSSVLPPSSTTFALAHRDPGVLPELRMRPIASQGCYTVPLLYQSVPK